MEVFHSMCSTNEKLDKKTNKKIPKTTTTNKKQKGKLWFEKQLVSEWAHENEWHAAQILPFPGASAQFAFLSWDYRFGEAV